MKKSILVSTLLGGVILYLWSMMSWMVLPWHCMTLNKFRNEEFVGWVISENAKTDGMYVLPHMSASDEGLSPSEKRKSDMARSILEKRGPYMVASVRLKGVQFDEPMPYIVGFFTQLVAAFFVSCFVFWTGLTSYKKRLGFVVLLALFAGLVGVVSDWNWWKFSAPYTLVALCDLIIGWTLAGLVMAKLIEKRTQAKR